MSVPPKRGRLKRSKSRNLAGIRLINYPDDVLRFMREIDVFHLLIFNPGDLVNDYPHERQKMTIFKTC